MGSGLGPICTGPALMIRQFQRRSVAAVALLVIVVMEHRPARAGSPSFCAAYFESGARPTLRLFSNDGNDETAPLPDDLPRDFYPVAFDPAGRVIYGQFLVPGSRSGIWMIQFGPARLSVVPGSIGLGQIWHLTVSPESGGLFISGRPKSGRIGDCGTFEITHQEGVFETLRQGQGPDCGGGGGPVSPDGKRALARSAGKLELVELETGAVQVIKGVEPGTVSAGMTWISGCEWSPDGRWIACARDGRIVLIGSDDTSQRKGLGRSGNGPLRWSPDSREILVSRSQIICGLGDGGSLEVIEVDTGKRRIIASSRCKVSSGVFGWIDKNSVR